MFASWIIPRCFVTIVSRAFLTLRIVDMLQSVTTSVIISYCFQIYLS
jgi:hypothetical protein